MKRNLIVLLISLFFNGAVFANIGNLPPINTEHEVYMGDKMVEERTGYYLKCLVPNFDVEHKDKKHGQIFIIKKDVPMCEKKQNSKSYIAPYTNGLKGKSKFPDLDYVVKLKGKKEGKFKICLDTALFDAYCEKNLTSDDFYFSKKFVSEKSSFQRVIEYAGKKGSIVKFIYSEFKDGMVREAFMREFEIDLNDGNTVAYKGCIFEIIKVDNATIKYKVLKHFEALNK